MTSKLLPGHLSLLERATQAASRHDLTLYLIGKGSGIHRLTTKRFATPVFVGELTLKKIEAFLDVLEKTIEIS
jgi:hypothetical protein